MKIAHLLPASILFPLAQPNGRYEWVLSLACHQARLGHDVLIYCGGGPSDTESLSFRNLAYYNPPDNHTSSKALNTALCLEALSDDSIDIFHSHFDNLHYEVGISTVKPIVFTQHWWPTIETVALANKYTSNNIWAVPPTRYMCAFDRARGIKTLGAIHHGIDLNVFNNLPISKNGRLLTVGRISPEKNVSISIEVAKKAGLGLDLIGKITDKNKGYWNSLKKDIDGQQIVYLGVKTHRELARYYTSAQAVLFPTDPHEAFGLVAIEAQACGTPVIMARGGSRKELLEEGKTGYLCSSMEEYVNAVGQSRSISASDCRNFANKFDVSIMIDRYEKLYRHLVD